ELGAGVIDVKAFKAETAADVAERSSGVDAARRVLDHQRAEAGARGVERGPRDAEVGGEADEVRVLQAALLEVAGQARHRLAVRFEERGVRVDVRAIALPDDELGV